MRLLPRQQCHAAGVQVVDENVSVSASDGDRPVTDFRGWVHRVGLYGPGSGHWSRFELHALTAQGPVVIVSGPDLVSLSWYPPDRLTLGPVTFGGMVVRRDSMSVRITCLDTSGNSEVWRASGSGFQQQQPEASDVDAIAVMWRLMDAQATRPVIDEILGRLLLWAWIADSGERWRSDPGFAAGSPTRWRLVPGRNDSDEPGIHAFSRGNLHALARLLGVALETPTTTAGIGRMALLLDHPSLEMPGPVAGRTLTDEVDFLHACVPTRWSMAADLRSLHHRSDLAEMVMAAPTPDL
jgi:hypothetical protein